MYFFLHALGSCAGRNIDTKPTSTTQRGRGGPTPLSWRALSMPSIEPVPYATVQTHCKAFSAGGDAKMCVNVAVAQSHAAKLLARRLPRCPLPGPLPSR